MEKNENKIGKIMPMFYILAILITSIFVVACTVEKPSTIPINQPTENLTSGATQDLKKFSSTSELREFLKNSQSNQEYLGGYYGSGGSAIRDTMMVESEAVMAPTAKASGSAEGNGASGAGAVDYSQTNVQVAGVDEADFVKNDNKYIYSIVQNKLVIVDAYPAENAKILSETKLNGTPTSMFINKDRLVVFTQDYEDVYVISEYDFMPISRSVSVTHALVYDVSDRKNPELVKDYHINGNYFESRMIDNYVYFIVSENVYYYNNIVDVPVIKESARRILAPEIYYFDNPEYNYNFNTVAAFDVFSDNDNINAKTFMMGYTNNLYVSKNNIYITYQKNLPYTYYRTSNQDRFYTVILPLLPSSVQDKIKTVKNNDNLGSDEKWNQISAELEDMYNRMEETEKQNLMDDIQKAIDDYEQKLEVERRKTIIHKINIDKGDIHYDTRGEVPGYLLNQFSMDENGDYFRVATTVELYTRNGSNMYNNVYVLDKKLNVVGELENIAPDESIYSTRFIGDRLYMVTFKRVDPLFVIDLSNPEKPEILGKLNIPGFSDYLHPYDETHIIGIGKETDSNEWGGTSIKGVKIALFDVSDVEHPKQIDTYEIGQAGTDSEALRDHKAFLFDKEKNILVIPIREVKGTSYYDKTYGYYIQRVWQGAYVFGVTPENGFELKGKISHFEGDEDYRYYWGSPSAIRRALYMDDVLYTVSATTIKMNDMNNISKEINKIDLPFEKQDYYYPVWY